MKRILCASLPQEGKPVELEETEAHHAIQVLRLRDGDRVEALDGQGRAAPARIRTKGGPPRLEKAEGESRSEDTLETLPLVLELAILKGDAMEWAIEKAVELGVDTLVPVVTAHTVVQVKKKGGEAFQARWQKIADQALKQCGRLRRMTVEPPIELEELLTRNEDRIWAVEPSARTQNPPQHWRKAAEKVHVSSADPLHLLIGPEGGWSAQEIDILDASPKVLPATLGPLTLRGETAAIVASAFAADWLRSSQS